MQYIRSILCIEVQSVLEAALIARIPEYGSGDLNGQRVDKSFVYNSYASRPLLEVLQELSIVVKNIDDGSTSGVVNTTSKEIHVLSNLDTTYLCLSESSGNKLSFFH